MKRFKRYANAGYTREEWRELRGYPVGPIPRADPTPREENEIALDLRDQLERLWSHFPEEFRQ